MAENILPLREKSPSNPENHNQEGQDGNPDDMYDLSPSFNANGANKQLEEIDLFSLQITSSKEFPIELDIAAEFQNILAAGILNNSEYSSVYDKITKVLFSTKAKKLCTYLFWIVYILKFQPGCVDVLEELRIKLGKLYTKFFAGLEQPKETLTNLTLFLSAYATHVMFYNIFPGFRNQFNLRFILDCYHIVIFEVNGVYVSDYYLQNFIEKIFGNKFFYYEKEKTNKKKKTEKNDRSNEPLLRGLNFDLSFLMNVPGSMEFANELAQKLHKNSKKFRHTSSLGTSDTSTVQKTHTTNNLMKKRERDHSKHDEQEELMSPNSNAHVSSTLSPLSPTSPELKIETSKSTGNLADVHKYLPRMKFNCLQISPTVSRFLSNSNMSLPFRKKKIIQYSNNKHLADIKKIDLKKTNIEQLIGNKVDKKEHKEPTYVNNVAKYDLKNRPDDYYLDYMSKEMKTKFRDELDLKYILDNVAMHPHGGTVRSMVEELSNKRSQQQLPPIHGLKKHHYMSHGKLPGLNTSSYQISLQKDQELSTKGLEESTVANNEVENATSESFNTTNSGLKNTLQASLSDSRIWMSTIVKKSSGYLEPVLTKKNTIRLRQDDRILEKNELENEGYMLSSGRLETGEVRDADLKADILENTKKARMNNLLPPEEHPNRIERFIYKDKRKEYMARHLDLVDANTDANIDGLVHKLISKKGAQERKMKPKRKKAK